MTYSEVLQLFENNSDSTYNAFNSSITKSGVKSFGCTVPFVRSLAKRCLQNFDEVLSFPLHEWYEVDLLKGIVVAMVKLPFQQKQHYLSAFAKTIENWAVCDCSTVKIPHSEANDYFEFFCKLAADNYPFAARYGLVNLMSFLDEAHIDGVFDALRGICGWGNYYVDMAAAWLLATAMAKCRSQTIQFVEGTARDVLSPFAYNKGLQKMRESNRISPQDKEWAKSKKIDIVFASFVKSCHR